MWSDSIRLAAITAGLLMFGVALAGCAATTEASETPAAQPSVTGTPTPDWPASSDSAAPEPSSSVQPTISPGEAGHRAAIQAEYDAAIAAWPEALPPAYSWPAWADLPHIDPSGRTQIGQADNATGVYRCILIDAAWHAYFEANDPLASKGYATRADKYVIPDNPSTQPVTKDGIILDGELASANGICRGISGDLQH